MANNIYELDFTGIQSSNFIPEGNHTVRITDAEFKKASTGSDQLQVTFEASDGSIRSMWFSLLPQALWKLKGFLETLGIPCDGKIKLNTASFKNKTCIITVEPDPNDESRLVVSRVSKATPPQANASIAYASAPATPVAPAMANTPVSPIPVAPAEPVAVQPAPAVPPVQQAQQPIQQNLPPWMTQPTNAPQASVPSGNLPPWMTQK